jgi:D-threo-aldose 1-dehydrogenase
MEAICAEFSVSLAAAALQFPLGHPAVTNVIPGGKSGFESDRNIETFNVSIPNGLWVRFKEQGLIPEGVPTPLAK